MRDCVLVGPAVLAEGASARALARRLEQRVVAEATLPPRRRRDVAPARPAPAANPAGPATVADDASAPGLAIPDYDELSASQVVDRLDGLSAGALDAIRAYEQAHRGRATILGKIEQLGQTG